ncbi:MAG: PspA-associated protein PspAA [Solirubrobacteraceae bacterium]
MIVRISGEDQFVLADSESEYLNQLESAVVEAVEAGNEPDYEAALSALLEHVRSVGRPVADDELEGSDLILPPADTTLEEAAAEFTGEGLIPD